MMTSNLRKVLVSVAVSALLAGSAWADADEPSATDGDVSVTEPDVAVDPATEGEPDMWTGGSPDFCEACGSEPVDNIEDLAAQSGLDGGDEGGTDDDVNDLGVNPDDIEPRIRETMADGEAPSAPTAARDTADRSGGECQWTPRQMYCAD